MIELAGLLAAAVLLITLVTLEVRRTAPEGGQPARPMILGRTVSGKVIAVIWAMYLLLFLPRLLGLLT